MWKNIRKKIRKLPPFVRNIYFVCGSVFAVWMLFLDDDNLVNQYRKHAELSALQEKRDFYRAQIDETKKEYDELNTNVQTQEKFAREHYWMKRDNEDVFVIVNK